MLCALFLKMLFTAGWRTKTTMNTEIGSMEVCGAQEIEQKDSLVEIWLMLENTMCMFSYGSKFWWVISYFSQSNSSFLC